MKPVETNPNFIEIEHKVIDFWDKEECFKKLVEKNRKGPRFRFLDGPITANNPMGVHHTWGRTLKDIFLRYKALRGHHCHYQNGFDCQGLWVEVEVEKELGFKTKADIMDYGLDKFSEACKKRVEKYSGIQTEQSIRLGQWMDWDDSYYTHRDSNILAIWHFLKKCHENGWLYRTGLPMPWCARCGTSLSEHEMSGSYQQMSHRSVYIELQLKGKDAKILVWTTTPWTLAANTALAVHPDLAYVEVDVEGEDAPLILCEEATHALKGKQCKVLRTFSGKELIGIKYEPVISNLPVQQKVKHRIVAWEEVDASEGTGVVHIAPGCGLEDHELGKEKGLDVLSPIDDSGIYVDGYGWLEGKSVMKVADEIIDYLKQNGKLYHDYMHEHSYPVCWRCKEELIFRLVDEWFINCNEIRPRMIKASADVQWQPDYVGKRMEDWLNNMGDWCISRKRFWGLPLPFYVCPSCEKLTVVGSLEELEELSWDKIENLPELHKPWIDEIDIKCPHCGEKTPRIPEIGDCWLDAGIVPYSTRGYFENREEWKKWYPIEWICEMREQVRLWFYSMLFMGVTLDDRSPYERVLTYERVVSEEGEMFSKTGFMIRFEDAAEKMGVDTMRYRFASQSVTSDIRFGYKVGNEARRQLLAFWNIYAFFVTYARIDNPEVSKVEGFPKGLTDNDKWLLAKTTRFVEKAQDAMEEYNTPALVKEFESFTEDVSNWYIRTNRRRFWRIGPSDDKLAGYWSLFQALKSALIVMSPIVPFMTEEIWQNAVRNLDSNAPLSVHHADWPAIDKEWRDEKLLARVEIVRNVVYLALQLRNKAQIKVRQPLAVLYYSGPASVKEAVESMKDTIQGELNIKNIDFLEDENKLMTEYLTLNLAKAGPALQKDLPQVRSIIENLDDEQMKNLIEQYHNQEKISLPDWRNDLSKDIFELNSAMIPNTISTKEDNLFVALNTELTEELMHEGWIRDLLRYCQVLRKEAGLAVEERIHLAVDAQDGNIQSVIRKYEDYIQEETLADSLSENIDDPLKTEEIEINDVKVRLALKRA